MINMRFSESCPVMCLSSMVRLMESIKQHLRSATSSPPRRPWRSGILHSAQNFARRPDLSQRWATITPKTSKQIIFRLSMYFEKLQIYQISKSLKIGNTGVREKNMHSGNSAPRRPLRSGALHSTSSSARSPNFKSKVPQQHYKTPFSSKI